MDNFVVTRKARPGKLSQLPICTFLCRKCLFYRKTRARSPNQRMCYSKKYGEKNSFRFRRKFYDIRTFSKWMKWKKMVWFWVSYPGKSLLWVAVLGLVVFYLYAVVGFALFRSTFDPENSMYCDNLWQCTVTVIRFGLIGDLFEVSRRTIMSQKSIFNPLTVYCRGSKSLNITLAPRTCTSRVPPVDGKLKSLRIRTY